MKNSIITLAFVFYMAAAAGNGPDSSYCLEISGKILNAGEAGNQPCKVELYCMNRVIDSAMLKESRKKFRFYLRRNQYYTIRITMENHMNKLICVDTQNAPNPVEEDLFYFSFETSLLDNERAARLNKDVAEMPVAILYFDARHDRFDYNKAYTSNIKREMYLTAK
jgi:hypothetical protein